MASLRVLLVTAGSSFALLAGCAPAASCPEPRAAAPAAVPAPSAPLAPSASAPDAPHATAPTTDDMAEVSATLDRFHAAASAADEATYFSLFAEGGVFLGTDGKERWTVPEFRAYAHPRFATGKAWSFRAAHRNISLRGDTALFDEELVTQNLGPARGSGALVRERSGQWRVALYDLSIPIPNERFAEVRKVIDGAASREPAPKPSPPATTPGGAEHPVCAAARSARARSSPAAAALDAQCRAAGGKP